MDLYQIASYVIAIVVGCVGGYYLIFKKKTAELKAVLAEIAKAAEDDNFTKEELKAIVDAALKLIKF